MRFVCYLLYKEGGAGYPYSWRWRQVAGGACPAPTGWRVFDCVVLPVGCDARQIATGDIYAAPTNQPVIFIKI